MSVPTNKSCGDTVAIAVRPEKLKLSVSKPADAKLLAIAGKVRDVAYYGDTSHVVVSAADGLDLQINVQNDTRTGGSGVERGQKIWVSWAPDDSIVLTE
jgi:putrescine transport system ATP-binding protein